LRGCTRPWSPSWQAHRWQSPTTGEQQQLQEQPANQHTARQHPMPQHGCSIKLY
jgi:hypothetical protein